VPYSASIFNAENYAPRVASSRSENVPSEYLFNKHVLPTPESPTITTLKVGTSYVC